MPSVPRTKGSFENSAGNVGKLRAARAGSGRIARLRHEAVDHAVENDAVIEATVRQRLDLLHMLGAKIGPQRDRDFAIVFQAS